MPLDNNHNQSVHNQSAVVEKTALILIASLIVAAESLFPRVPLFPWMKPGFANTITIIWIIRYGTFDALLFSLIRIWISGVYLGVSFYSLMLGLCGAFAAVPLMGFWWNIGGRGRLFGGIGVSIIGALAHNAGQLVALWILLDRAPGLRFQIPIMLGASLFFGTISGYFAPIIDSLMIVKLNSAAKFHNHELKRIQAPISVIILTTGILGASIGLLFVDSTKILTCCAIAVTVVSIIEKKSVYLPTAGQFLHFWPLFVFIGFVNFLHPFGNFDTPFNLLSKEAIQDTVTQNLRLWSWLQLGMLANAAGFHRFFADALVRTMKSRADTIVAAMIGMEKFGELFVFGKRILVGNFLSLLSKPFRGVRSIIESFVMHACRLALNCQHSLH